MKGLLYRKVVVSTLTALLLSVFFVSSLPAQADNASPTGSPSTTGRPQGAPTPPSPSQMRNAQEATQLEAAISALFSIVSPSRPADTTAASAESLYQQGVNLERSGRVREAAVNYDAALRLRPTDPRIHVALARVVEPENPALAIFHYQSAFRYAIEEASDQVPAIEIMRRFLVGRYLQYALPIDNPSVSANLLELAESLAPEDPRVHAHLATAYFYLARYEKSIQESNNALALGFVDGVIHTNIAAAFAQLRMRDDAESSLQTALNLDEMDINAALNAVRDANQGDTLVTFKALLGQDRLDAIMNGSAKGMLEKALLTWNDNNKAEGLRLATAAAAAHPRHSYALIVVGDFKRALGDTPGAKAAYAGAAERNPNNQLALPRLGDISFMDHDYDAAARYYTEAMDRMLGRVDRIDILDRTAVALAQQGKHDQALALLDKWLRANPNAPEAFELSVRKAGILADAGRTRSDATRTREAELLLRGLITRDKLNPSGYVVLYTYYMERVPPQEQKARSVINDGLVLLRAAKSEDPLNPALYRDLARLYRVIGSESAARQTLLDGGLRTSEKRYFSNALFASDAETEAFEVAKAWIAAEPRNPEAVLSYGWVAASLSKDLVNAMGRVEDLAAMYAGADLVPVRRTRAYLNFALKNYAKSIDDIQVFLVSDEVPQAAFFHRLWGFSADALNHRAEAIEHLSKALALNREENADLQIRIDQLTAQNLSQPAPSSVPAPASSAPAAGHATTTRQGH